MVCYYCYLVHKDESTTTLEHSNIADSLFNLKTLPPISSRQTEILHHRRHYHQPYHKAVGQNTLKKTDEHCRSLFNLLPSTLRPHQHHQTSNNKSVDAVSIKNERAIRMNANKN